MNTTGGAPDNDAQWRRPAHDQFPAPGRHDQSPAPGYPAQGGAPGRVPDLPPLGYSGPPPSTPPPAHWRPPMFIQPAPPRRLPTQDHPSLDAEEQSARTLTYGVGMVVGAILLVALCALCARALV